jgi:hypothetical protein
MDHDSGPRAELRILLCRRGYVLIDDEEFPKVNFRILIHKDENTIQLKLKPFHPDIAAFLKLQTGYSFDIFTESYTLPRDALPNIAVKAAEMNIPLVTSDKFERGTGSFTPLDE